MVYGWNFPRQEFVNAQQVFMNDMHAFVFAVNIGTAGILFLFIKRSEIIVQQTTDYGTKKKSRTGRNL